MEQEKIERILFLLFFWKERKLIMHKQFIWIRFEKSLPFYEDYAVVQREMAGKLAEKIGKLRIPGKRILEIGCGSGLLTRVLAQLEWEELIVNDLIPQCGEKIRVIHPKITFLAGDAEGKDFPGDFDLIASNATFQWLKSPQAFLQKMKEKLRPGGILAFTTFGPGNFQEIREIVGEGLDYYSLEEWIEMARCLKPIKIWEEERVLLFDSHLDVLKHICRTGVNGLSKTRWSLADAKYFASAYEKLKKGKSYPLTYRPLYLFFRKNP